MRLMLFALYPAFLLATPPSISPGGVVNAASALDARPASPGSLISIYGSHLAQSTLQGSTNAEGRLPTELGGTRVAIGGVAAYLVYVSPSQINALVPFEVAPGTRPVVVTTAEGTSAPYSLSVSAASPGIFPGSVVKNSDFSPVSDANRAHPGEILVAFLTGMGLVEPPLIGSGQLAPASPLLHTALTPSVAIGPIQAEVVYSLLTPGYAGIYQVAFKMPSRVKPNPTLGVSVAGIHSNAVPLFVDASGITDLAPSIGSVHASYLAYTGRSYRTGSMIRISVDESSGENDLARGTMRITSASQRYDSGAQTMTLRPPLCHWDTTGLNPANDYVVEVKLTDQAGQEVIDRSLTLTLTPKPPTPNMLVRALDVRAPAIGIPVELVRTYILDSHFDGPLGFGWTHTYLQRIFEAPDGVAEVFNPDGTGSFFKPKGAGAYGAPKGERRTLVRHPDGTFQLRDRGGATWRFDALGLLTSIQDRNGNRVTLTYDGRRLSYLTDASGRRTTFEYNTSGRIQRITDPASRSVTYDYDDQGNLTATTDIGGFTTRYAYDSSHHLTSVTSPSGVQTRFFSDAQERLVKVVRGDSINSLSYEYSQAFPTVSVTDGLGRRLELTYDNHGLITATKDPLGGITTFTYDDSLNLIRTRDANGQETLFSYDPSGNLTSATDPLGNRTSFTYEPVFHQVTSITDSKSNVTRFTYDTAGNLRSTVHPGGGTENYTYDAAGNMVSKTDRMKQTTTFAYDSRGLLTSMIFPTGASRRFTYSEAGRLLTVSDWNGTLSFAYDNRDRPMRVTYPRGQTVSYAYDAAGNRSRLIYPDGSAVDYAYDAANRLTTIRRGGQTLATYTYDDMSRVVKRELQNGTTATYTYDQANRLIHLGNSSPGGAVFSRFGYTYDAAGNRLTMTTAAGTTGYVYDAAGQLIRVIPPGASAVSYEFDASGNRLSVTQGTGTTSYSVNDQNQYTSVGGTTYAYDANGNLTRRTAGFGSTTYSYDSENRLVRVHTPSGTVSYTYDFLGRRLSKTTASGTTYYIHDDLRVIAEADAAGAWQATYVYGLGIDEVLTMRRRGVDLYYSHDGLGSASNLTDSHGLVVESYSYDAYGAPSRASSAGNPYLFTGREFDPETGLYYYRARYYDPVLGRFFSVDPLGAPLKTRLASRLLEALPRSGLLESRALAAGAARLLQGVNPYSYVNNNPVNTVDPSGEHAPWWVPGLDPSEDLPYLSPERQIASASYGGRSVSAGDPTFVQPVGKEEALKPRTVSARSGLVCKITVPYENSLVRGCVPIFGVAHGRNFRSYRVEYGAGRAPTKWTTVTTSTVPRTKDVTAADLDDSADKTIQGNLATWDTGLTEYSYYTHPPGHPVNLSGVYTVRLVVVGRDGKTAEDRVTVEVGRVLSNVYRGAVASADGNLVLRVPEQAILEPFRVVSIRRVERVAAPIGPDYKLASDVYELRPAGERFTKEIGIEVAAPGGPNRGREVPGIFIWDPKDARWEGLASDLDPDRGKVTARLSAFPPEHAYVALLRAAPGAARTTVISTRPNEPLRPAAEGELNSPGRTYVTYDTFENGLGGWSNRDGEVGAVLSLDNTVTADGGKALKLTNPHGGGNFASTILRTPFDARQFPIVEFDYRVPGDVKLDLLVKVDGRWYDIGFTDDPNVFEYKRVNMARIGRIENVVRDDRWHTARFDLSEMLRTKTRNRIVQEMVMADWDVRGYMKLGFGRNRAGAAYWIDNFRIGRNPAARSYGPTLAVDRFVAEGGANLLGGESGLFTSPDGAKIEKRVSSQHDSVGPGGSLELKYDVAAAGSYAGYWTRLKAADLSEYQALTFWVRGERGGEAALVQLEDRLGNEAEVKLDRYLPGGITASWQKVTLPLAAFNGIQDWSSGYSLSFAFQNLAGASRGRIFVGDIHFEEKAEGFYIEDFEDDAGTNLLGGGMGLFSGKGCRATGRYIEESPGGANKVYRLTYSVTNRFDSCAWATSARGIDVSAMGSLSLAARTGQPLKGVHLYLNDGIERHYVPLEKYAMPSVSWERLTIPLEEYSRQGMDLTHIEEVQIAFEGSEMQGAIDIDDLQFLPAKAGGGPLTHSRTHRAAAGRGN